MDPPRHDELRDAREARVHAAAITEIEPRVRAIARRSSPARPRRLRPGHRRRGTRAVGGDRRDARDPPRRPPAVPGLDRGADPAQARRARDHRRGAGRERRELSEYLGDPDRGASARRHRRPHRLSRSAWPTTAARLDDEELLGFVRLLLVAGNETTINLIGNAFLDLGRHPDQRARPPRIHLTRGRREEVLRSSRRFPSSAGSHHATAFHHGVDSPRVPRS